MQVTGYRPQATGQVTGQVIGHRSRATGHVTAVSKQCLKFLADYTLTQQHFVVRSVSNRPPSSKEMEDRSSGKKSLGRGKYEKSCRISVVK